MVCDFFYPQLGGVQVHIYELAKQLYERGHRPIIMTHQYGDRVGVRWMKPGIKVYYIPLFSFSFNTIMPSHFLTLPLAREILHREKIDIVHSHQVCSVLSYEISIHARLLGIRTVHTEHSLFGFSDMASINLNKVIQLALSDCNKIICVSRTTRQNMKHRMNIGLDKLVIIPNAVASQLVSLNRVKRQSPRIKLVTVGRLFFRKGVDLMVEIIPRLFERYDVEWVIVGDGPKKYLLEHLVKKHDLGGRLKLIGRVEHEQVVKYLHEADLFVNPSLTESFGIAIVQAASMGLLCVSTDVGAVWQVLPPSKLVLCKPNCESLLSAIDSALNMIITEAEYLPIHQMYSWEKLVIATQKVYEEVMKQPAPTKKQVLTNYLRQNRFSGNMVALMIAVLIVVFSLLEWIRPRKNISQPIQINIKTQPIKAPS